MRKTLLLLLILFALIISGTPSVVTAQSDSPDYLATYDIYPGMKGYGLTTLQGNEIVRYPIKILSVMGNRGGANPHMQSILIMLDDGEFPDGWVGFQNDMTGSPIYIKDKLIGSVCKLYEWSMQDIAQVRPIDEMNLLAERYGNRNRIESAYERKTLLEKPDTNSVIVPAPSTETPSFRITKPHGTRALLPGDAVAAVWAIGDYTKIDKGNITEMNSNNEFFAFGRSVFGRVGQINAPLIRVDVLNTMKGFNHNFQVTNPELIVGVIHEDRTSGVYGKLGEKPDLLPIDVVIHDVLYNKTHNAFTMVINDDRFYPQLVQEAVSHSIRKQLNVNWEGTIDLSFNITFTVDSGAVKAFEARNIFYGTRIPAHAVDDLTRTLNTLANNDFGKVHIDKVSVEVFWIPTRETARIESLEITNCDGLWKKDERYILKRGDEVSLKAVLRPYKRQPIEQIIKIIIDDEFPKGDAVIQIRGGGYLLPGGNDISEEALKLVSDKLESRINIIEPTPPKGLEKLLSGLKFLTPSNMRIVELISTKEAVSRGTARYNQTDSEEMDYVIYGFDSILVEIKD